MKVKWRKWVKDEKRIVRLLYKKGMLPDNIQVDNLYWEYFRTNGRQRKRGCQYSFHNYLPEVHYCTYDYWGECDEHSVIENVKEGLYWKYSIGEYDTYGWPISSFTFKGRTWFIKYLKSLPTVNNDNKIRVALKRTKE